MSLIASDKRTVVVGLGLTGLSCVRFLLKNGHQVSVVDSRNEPPGLLELRKEFPDVPVYLGEFDEPMLCSAAELVVSPGISVDTPAIAAARASGVRVRGDIDLFREYARAPVVAITGSNGKSTVTSMVGEMAKAAGRQVAVGGNIGVPALDLLNDEIDLYVLELSSFQLETTVDLGATVATVLNLSDDHMDRYSSRLGYLQAKQRVFQGCRKVVVNDDDPLSAPLIREGVEVIRFGLDQPDVGKFSSRTEHGCTALYFGFDQLLNVDELSVRGRHNHANALAALALGRAVGLPMTAMLSALRNYEGLPHRCEWLGEVNGVGVVNDSKGTNVGATAAAIESFGKGLDGKIVLLAGGVGKGADFSPLQKPLNEFGRSVVLFGQDARVIGAALEGVDRHYANTLTQALDQALSIANVGDIILFSPACASFDMFRNFEARGEAFRAMVVER